MQNGWVCYTRFKTLIWETTTYATVIALGDGFHYNAFSDKCDSLNPIYALKALNLGKINFKVCKKVNSWNFSVEFSNLSNYISFIFEEIPKTLSKIWKQIEIYFKNRIIFKDEINPL